MQIRKPPAKRLYRPGLGGVPVIDAALDEQNQQAKQPAVEIAPIEAEPEAPKNKGGRPPKHGVTMTAAERMRAMRERRRWEAEGPERKKLVLAIRKRIKTSEHGNIEAMRRALSKFDEALDHTTLDQLRDIAKSYRIIHDRKGRLSLEGHTGGKDVEAIHAARQRDTIYGGRKPRMGASPKVDHELSTTPPRDWSTSSSLAQEEKSTGIRWNDLTKTVWDIIPEITERMFEGEEDNFSAEYDPEKVIEPALECQLCRENSIDGHGEPFLCASWFEARQHVEEMVKKGEDQHKFIEMLKDAVKTTAHYENHLADARKLYLAMYWRHHRLAGLIWKELSEGVS